MLFGEIAFPTTERISPRATIGAEQYRSTVWLAAIATVERVEHPDKNTNEQTNAIIAFFISLISTKFITTYRNYIGILP